MKQMELAFVLARGQNHFFVEIVAAIRHELGALGVESSVTTGEYPPLRDGLVYVLVPPHEWFALQGHRTPPTAQQLRRTVLVGAEQPGTVFFDDDLRLAPLAGATLDVNALAVRELSRRAGVQARHFPLGWTAAWSALPGAADGGPVLADEARDIDVLHLGILSDRRARALAAAAVAFAGLRTKLILGDPERPNAAARANFAIEDHKWDLLRRARVLLNIHVAERPYFEWLRVVQGICNGAAIVSEHSTGTDPLELGRHFLGARADAVGLVAAGLLRDESLRARQAQDALDFLRSELPFARSVQTLLEVAEPLAAAPVQGRSAPPAELAALAAPRRNVESGLGEGPPHDDAPDAVALLARPAATPVATIPWERLAGLGALAAALRATPEDLVFLERPGPVALPGALQRLAGALAEDEGALAAYGMVATYDDGDRPLGLEATFPWEDLVRRGEAPAVAVWRRAELLRLLDDEDAGARDHPWARLAATGGRAVMIQSIVARRRVVSA